MGLVSAETTNWLASSEQQFWFDRFAITCDHQLSEGNKLLALNFKQFQLFLKATVYCYMEKFPEQQVDTTDHGGQPQRENAGIETTDNDNKYSNLTDVLTQLDLSVRCNVSNEFSKLQEMHLFRRFDLNNDHSIDRDEFGQLCQRWLHQVFKPSCALVVVDVQNDFIDGSLALINGPARQDGGEVVPIINELIDMFQKHKATIVYTQDWHPQDHVSFHANLHLRKYILKEAEQYSQRERSSDGENQTYNGISHHEVQASSQANPSREFKYKRLIPKANLFDIVLFDEGRVEQKLWPIHCVRNSWGAQFHPKLKLVSDSIRIQKGTLSHVDAYSAFWDNMRANETGLRQELVNRRITDLFFCGLALDYCVATSALDATKAGFVTFVIDDACRGIDEQEMDKRKRMLQDHGALIVNSGLTSNYLRLIGSGSNAVEVKDFDHKSSKHCLNRTLIKTITYRRAFC